MLRRTQEEIIGRLRETLQGVRVEDFPDRPEEYRLNHPVGAVLVQFGGSRYGKRDDMGLLVQDRTMRFGCHLVWRSLNGEAGVLAALEACRRALLGFVPSHGKRLRAVRDGFQDQGGGLWRYLIEFETDALAVEDRQASSGPLLTVVRTLYDDDDGNNDGKEADDGQQAVQVQGAAVGGDAQ